MSVLQIFKLGDTSSMYDFSFATTTNCVNETFLNRHHSTKSSIFALSIKYFIHVFVLLRRFLRTTANNQSINQPINRGRCMTCMYRKTKRTRLPANSEYISQESTTYSILGTSLESQMLRSFVTQTCYNQKSKNQKVKKRG